ncbi:MAG: DUF3365 domain-containing protein [Planctomycetes bacterium]|nr:DUF3365 domain-containing protein [Planctomycetota bacterium]
MIRRVLCALALCACSPGEATWRTTAEPDAARVAKAEVARDALGGALLAELQQALASGGPAQGIQVCRERAPAIAAEVSAEHGVSIGRTSFQLRNTRNRPPAWAMDSVREKADSPRFFESSTGALGALYPIRLAPHCVVCHGPPERIAAPVREALSASYPDDAATGFEPGDLRGWFWVEVP